MCEIPLRRMQRLMGDLGAGGLYDAFLRVKNDELVYFGDVVDWLSTAVPGLDRGKVVTRFQLAVKYGVFGRRGYGQIVDLIDLDAFRDAAPARYALRPFWRVIETRPETVRTSKSRWARWLREQGWPVPGWLATAPAIEGAPTTIDVAVARALPAPAAAAKQQAQRNKGGRPPTRRLDVIAWYKALPKKDQERCSKLGLAQSYVQEHPDSSVGYVQKLLRIYWKNKTPAKTLDKT